MTDWKDIVKEAPTDVPVLIAGATASGKSALAMALAEVQDRTIVNADALQVYDDWRILTARPSVEDEKTVLHALYGHIPGDQTYSVGQWLRDVAATLTEKNPIIVGGTGLYFTALTEGLADIPPTPEKLRREADERMAAEGIGSLLAELDSESAARIDRQNPARVQRAWEVLHATGRGIASWQDDTGPPILPLAQTHPLVLSVDKHVLASRIESRFAAMVDMGVMQEVASNDADWSPTRPSSKAIGAAELIACHRGDMSMEGAAHRVALLSRQYAKRQRSWFRGRMGNWKWIDPSA